MARTSPTSSTQSTRMSSICRCAATHCDPLAASCARDLPMARACVAQGIKFTDNVVADPDLSSAVADSTLLIFVLPHQFLGRICPQMSTVAPNCRAISLIKVCATSKCAARLDDPDLRPPTTALNGRLPRHRPRPSTPEPARVPNSPAPNARAGHR